MHKSICVKCVNFSKFNEIHNTQRTRLGTEHPNRVGGGEPEPGEHRVQEAPQGQCRNAPSGAAQEGDRSVPGGAAREGDRSIPRQAAWEDGGDSSEFRWEAGTSREGGRNASGNAARGGGRNASGDAIREGGRNAQGDAAREGGGNTTGDTGQEGCRNAPSGAVRKVGRNVLED